MFTQEGFAPASSFRLHPVYRPGPLALPLLSWNLDSAREQSFVIVLRVRTCRNCRHGELADESINLPSTFLLLSFTSTQPSRVLSPMTLSINITITPLVQNHSTLKLIETPGKLKGTHGTHRVHAIMRPTRVAASYSSPTLDSHSISLRDFVFGSHRSSTIIQNFS